MVPTSFSLGSAAVLYKVPSISINVWSFFGVKMFCDWEGSRGLLLWATLPGSDKYGKRPTRILCFSMVFLLLGSEMVRLMAPVLGRFIEVGLKIARF